MTTNTKPTLHQIGREMRAEALANPGQRLERKLERGLILIMLHRPPVRMQLSLVRHRAWPSTKEIQTVVEHFGYIPSWRTEKPVINQSYHIVRLIWDDPQQLTFLPSPAGHRPPSGGRGAGGEGTEGGEGDKGAYHD